MRDEPRAQSLRRSSLSKANFHESENAYLFKFWPVGASLTSSCPSLTGSISFLLITALFFFEKHPCTILVVQVEVAALLGFQE